MGERGRQRRFGAAEKVGILKRHLAEKEEVHPNQFYEWQRLFFENGVKAFESDEERAEAKLREENERLQAKLQRKDSVLSELMEEHVALKKSLGEA